MRDRRGELSIRPLTRERLTDVGRLFELDSSARWCRCAYFRMRSTEFSKGTVASHRAALERAVKATSAAGRAQGLIAYRAGEPVGWVSVGPRSDYPRLSYSKALGPIDDQPVWSIVCFVVAPRERGRGVGRALLDAAVDYSVECGASLIEAYPAEVDGKRLHASDVYGGTTRMFERAGFEVVARRRATGRGRERPIMRRPPRDG